MSRLELRRAAIRSIERAGPDLIQAAARADGEGQDRRVVAYPALTGPLAVGDRVLLNVTATALGLGTGGVDFVVACEGGAPAAALGDPAGDEHIMKLRYTPLQVAVSAAELSPDWVEAETLDRVPVVVCSLHSQIAPAAAAVRAVRPDARIAYVMTDAAALPIALSHLVRALKAAGLLDATLTAGQAFGGDYECVSPPSALLAARHRARADVVLVGQGPGNAGTGTPYGFSGVEQGWLLDIAGRLGGTAVGALRLSLADPRPRHRGLSHHSVTALARIAQSPARVAFPRGWPALMEAVAASPIGALHRVEEADGAPGIALLAARGVRVASMGRTIDDDPVFFHAAAAAGALAAELSKRL